MYSLNVPVPSNVAALASEIARELPEARMRVRGEHTLCVKRLEATDRAEYDRIEARIREVLAGQESFDIRLTGLDLFSEPLIGSAPVVYLSLDAPKLEWLHRDLVETFGTAEPIEGEEYIPHVTVARGGSYRAAKDIRDRDVEPIEWTVSNLVFWDAERKRRVSSIALED